MIAGATREGDTWYAPRLVESPNFEAEGKRNSQNKRLCGDKCRDKAQKEENGEACNEVLTHRKGIQDGYS